VSVLIYCLAVTLTRMLCVKMAQEAADDVTICRYDYPGSYDIESNQCVKLSLKELSPILSTLFIAVVDTVCGYWKFLQVLSYKLNM